MTVADDVQKQTDDDAMTCAVCDKEIAPEETFWIADTPVCRECWDSEPGKTPNA